MKQMLAGIAAWFASFNLTRDVTVAYIGVPLNVLVACAIGAYCSFSVGDRIESRRTMWGIFTMCMLMGGALTSIVNAALLHYLGVTMTDALQAGVGAVVAFLTRFFLPWLADVVKNGKWLAWVPFGRNRSNGE